MYIPYVAGFIGLLGSLQRTILEMVLGQETVHHCLSQRAGMAGAYPVLQESTGAQVLDKAILCGEVVATFRVPYRPKLFGKLRPLVLTMESPAIEKDEVFLFLVFLYCEAKRQDKMVCLLWILRFSYVLTSFCRTLRADGKLELARLSLLADVIHREALLYL